MLAITYLTALLPGKKTPERKALAWIGGLALIPGTAAVILSDTFESGRPFPLPDSYRLLGWGVAVIVPLLLAWRLRRNAAWMNMIAALWVAALGAASFRFQAAGNPPIHLWHELGTYVMCMLGSIGLITWGLKEARKERINLGVAGFALTVSFFYFSNVMDKVGRSASLIGLGLLFILGGWLLEKTRRRLVALVGKEG